MPRCQQCVGRCSRSLETQSGGLVCGPWRLLIAGFHSVRWFRRPHRTPSDQESWSYPAAVSSISCFSVISALPQCSEIALPAAALYSWKKSSGRVFFSSVFNLNTISTRLQAVKLPSGGWLVLRPVLQHPSPYDCKVTALSTQPHRCFHQKCLCCLSCSRVLPGRADAARSFRISSFLFSAFFLRHSFSLFSAPTPPKPLTIIV